ncbi:MAG: NAD(P)/FAD-dependent oxidoreductase [Patescibacteria group bacterium]|nr:NAD(P)/FAD-dependent oxidoreductase [Patescibacteria group bacterium]
MSHPLLFKNGKIGKMTTKNRLVMAPMVRNYADSRGLVTPRYIDHIESIASGGVGTLILEAAFIRPDGRGFKNELGIHDDSVIPGLKSLVKVAHKHKAKIGMQIFHAGRQTSSQTTGKTPIAPSPIPDPTVGEKPRELTAQEIDELTIAFGQAAARAKKAGMDFVEIHGAHGYLITQFLSPFSNHREDSYGGSATNRMKFLRDVFKSVRLAVGKDFPLIVRLSGDEMIRGGLTLADTRKIAVELEKMGADALHISAGNYASYAKGSIIPPMAAPDLTLVHLAKGVKEVVKIPVIAVAKIRTPALAEKVLKEKSADFIALGRPLLADPMWPAKAAAGKDAKINLCIACNQGCISRLFEQKDVHCTVNPGCGFEAKFKIKKSKGKKKVLIIGGGPGGMSAAKTAAERGFDVVLYEESNQLGGQLHAAAAAPFREDWETFRTYLVNRLGELPVKIKLNTLVDTEIIKKEKADAVIIATGSTPLRLNIPGIDSPNVIIARDLLEEKSRADGRVVVAGGGCQGAQTAEYLVKKGHPVTLIEATSDIALEAPIDERSLLLERLKSAGVNILAETQIVEMGSNYVKVDGKKGPKKIPTDTIVLCFGAKSRNHLYLQSKQYSPKVIKVGDALNVRRVTEAVFEGAMAALSI